MRDSSRETRIPASDDDAAPEAASRQAAESLWALVIESGGSANLYRWDDDLQAPALSRVEHPAIPRGADLARIPLAGRDRHAASSPALLTLILAEPPLAPGAWARVRVLGAFPVGAHGLEGDALARSERVIALAAVADDPALAEVAGYAALPPVLRARAERAMRDLSAPDGLASIGEAASGWIGAQETMALYRAARVELTRRGSASRAASVAAERERLTTRDEALGDALAQRWRRDAPASSRPAGGGEVAWRGLRGVSAAEWRARGAAALGETEHLLDALPPRFMGALGGLLAVDERALFFLEAPAFTTQAATDDAALWSEGEPGARSRPRWPFGARGAGRASPLLRPRRLPEGLLLITDRQLLLLRDAAAHTANSSQPGYIATSWPLGRLLLASVVSPGQRIASVIAGWPERIRARLTTPTPGDELRAATADSARLALALEGHDGIQLAGCALPAEAEVALKQAAVTLNACAPLHGHAGVGDRRLRRLASLQPWRPTETEARELASLGGLLAPAVAAALAAASAPYADSPQTLAQAQTPETRATGPTLAALLTLTPTHLALATASARSQPTVIPTLRTLPLGAVTSVTLRYSLIDSWLRLTCPGTQRPGECEVIEVAFPSPLIAPFRALRNRLCESLAAGPALGR